MNQFESNTSSTLVETIPYVLRRTLQERRLAVIENTEK